MSAITQGRTETFAQHRQAFGSTIGRYPLVLEALAEMKSELYALLASTLRLSSLVNRMDLGVATEQEQAVHRLLVNINKYASSVQASLGIRRAQEIMGGNGAIEDFSVVPRLYRDALAFFIDCYLRPGYDPLADDRYLERIARLGGSL